MEKIYKVIVDYKRSLAKMIKAGKYNKIDGDINDANFPIQGKGKYEVDLVVVETSQAATNAQVLMLLRRLNLMPANLVQLLAFRATYPNYMISGYFEGIVALGSSWCKKADSCRVPVLFILRHECELRTEWDGKWTLEGEDHYSPWNDGYNFLAVRNQEAV